MSSVRSASGQGDALIFTIRGGDTGSFMYGAGATVLAAIALAGGIYALYTYSSSARGLMGHLWKGVLTGEMTLLQGSLYLTLPIVLTGTSIGLLIHLKKRLDVLNAKYGNKCKNFITVFEPNNKTVVGALVFGGLGMISIPIILGLGALFKHYTPFHDWAMQHVVSHLKGAINTKLPTWQGLSYFGAGSLGLTLLGLLGKGAIDSLAERCRIRQLVKRTPVDISKVKIPTSPTNNQPSQSEFFSEE